MPRPEQTTKSSNFTTDDCLSTISSVLRRHFSWIFKGSLLKILLMVLGCSISKERCCKRETAFLQFVNDIENSFQRFYFVRFYNGPIHHFICIGWRNFLRVAIPLFQSSASFWITLALFSTKWEAAKMKHSLTKTNLISNNRFYILKFQRDVMLHWWPRGD